MDKFAGYIACDSRSRSEIVVLAFNDQGDLCAVLDLDSTELNAWSDVDRRGLENVVSILRQKL